MAAVVILAVTCIRVQSSACSCPGVCSVSISPKTLQFCCTRSSSLRNFAICSTSSTIGPPSAVPTVGSCPSYNSTIQECQYTTKIRAVSASSNKKLSTQPQVCNKDLQILLLIHCGSLDAPLEHSAYRQEGKVTSLY